MGKALTPKKLKAKDPVVGVFVLVCSLAFLGAQQPEKDSPARPTKPETSASQVVAGVMQPVQAAVLKQLQAFNHNRPEHNRQDCSLCHQREHNDPRPTFPGHAACINCHNQEFFARASVLCGLCHRLPMDAQARVIDFSKQLKQFGLRGFSHRAHLDAQKMPAGTAPLTCHNCHRFDTEGVKASFPRHPECYGCHTHQAGQKMGGCGSCHADAVVAMTGRRGLGTALRLYNFTHGSHFKQRSVERNCVKCHVVGQASVERNAPDVIRVSTVRGQKHKSACWTCHAHKREPFCTKCHVNAFPW